MEEIVSSISGQLHYYCLITIQNAVKVVPTQEKDCDSTIKCFKLQNVSGG